MIKITYLLAILAILSACQQVKEKEPSNEKTSSTDTLQSGKDEKVKRYYAKDLAIDGVYVCKNPNGVVERLFVTEQGKEIRYQSDKLQEPILLLSKRIMWRHNERSVYEVTFPQAPQEKYELTFTIYAQHITCVNPDGSTQLFEKETQEKPSVLWCLIFKGQRLESAYHYRSERAQEEPPSENGEIYDRVKEPYNTYGKLARYLRNTYTEEGVTQVIRALRVREREGKLIIPTWMGGDISDYSSAYLELLNETNNYSTYKLYVPSAPEGEMTFDHKISFKKEGGRYKLATKTGLGYN